MRGVEVNRAVKRILQVFKDTGFDPTLFPGKAFSPKETDPFILQTAWQEVRKNVEVIIREEISLGKNESLGLNFVSPDGGKSLYAFLPDYRRLDLREVIDRTTGGRASKPNDVSVIDTLTNVQGVKRISGKGFLPEYMTGGQPDPKKMAQAIEELIQFDQNALRPYGLTAFSKATDAVAVVTSSWVQAAGTDTVRYYWRLHYSLDRGQADEWRLDAKIDIGKRLASMSEDEIHVIGDSERNLDSLRAIRIMAINDPSAKEAYVGQGITNMAITAKASSVYEYAQVFIRRPVDDSGGGPVKVSVAPVAMVTKFSTFTYTVTRLGYEKLTGQPLAE